MRLNEFPRLILPDGRAVSVGVSPFTVGQAAHFCELAIDDEDIAPVHLQLEHDNDRWFVRDMKSKTGVVINGKNVPYGGRAPIDHGDRVAMGHVVVTFAERPDALVTEEETAKINAAYARLNAPENPAGQEEALGLIGLLWEKVEAAALLAGFDSGMAAVRAVRPAAADPAMDDPGEKQPPHAGQAAARHNIETLVPDGDEGQGEAARTGADNKNGASSSGAVRPKAVTDGDRSSMVSGSEPAFPGADRFDGSEGVMTPPDTAQSADVSASAAAFDLRDRAVDGHDAKARALHPMPAASEGTPDTAVSGLRLMPDDPALDPMVVGHFPFSIGKRSRCDYALKKSDVSRFHAVLTTDGASVYLTDKGSTNGTFAGDDRLTPEEPMKLDNGDHVTFAGYGFTVLI